MTDWRALLEKAIADDSRGMQGVADRIGYSRTTVSLVRAGKYPNADLVGAAVIATYVLVECPFFGGQSIKPTDCKQYAARDYRAINADQVEHWRACRKCPKNPTRQEA